jgi:carbamoyl-phosphate synthase large subunit
MMDAASVNVLFTSAGRRVELLRAFKRAYADLGLSGNIVAVDIDPLASALQEADRSYIVPRISDPAYIPTLIGICRQEQST